MTIRPLAEKDIPAAAELLRALDGGLTPAKLIERLKVLRAAGEHRVWVVEEAGAVLGVMHAFVRPALEKPCEVVVQSVAVDPARRNAGIGRALMAEAEQWARSLGHKSVALHTRNAAPFYRKLGYSDVATPTLMRKHFA